MNRFTVLAFDFGASSGRGIKAVFDGEGLSYEEIHRFENTPTEENGTLRWNFTSLCDEVFAGIEKAGRCDSIAFDTWGVDFGLLDEDGKLLEQPVHYRDTRTRGMAKTACEKLGGESLYKQTGNQIMDINTLFQLLAMKESDSPLLKKAKTLLFMPDLFAHRLTGEAFCEASIASTSQMLNLQTKHWATQVLQGLGLNEALLLPVVPSGTVTGSYKGAKVIAVAGHDTQCAVAALPAKAQSAAFLSCGTWSLLGTELDEPVLTSESMSLELSNEIGANGKINYLKNIIGLWLIQESRRQWKRQGEEYSYAQLEELALAAEPLRCFIDPDSPEFGVPGDIPSLVQKYCAGTGQAVPQTVGEIMRCIYESLALKYRLALGQIERASGKSFTMLHVLGGGAKDKLLCQMTANSCNISVTAGPAEATALGNIIIQLVALGALKSIDEGRELIAKTEKLLCYSPVKSNEWDTAFITYKKILKQEE